jgi:hypothetical protein
MNIPNIPDNLHKALFLIGLALIGFAYYKYDQNILDLENFAKELNEKYEEKYFQESKVLNLETDFQILCWEEAKKINVENFCYRNNSGELEFYRIITGNQKILKINDSLNNIWSKILAKREALNQLTEKLEFEQEDFKDFVNLTEEANYFNIIIGFFGGILAFIGISRWWRIQNIQDKIIASNLPLKPKFNHCQSCGRNFSFKVLNGTNIDNSLSELFCSDCFNNGKFTSFLDESSINPYIQDTLEFYEKKTEKEHIKRRFENLLRWNYDDFKDKF